MDLITTHTNLNRNSINVAGKMKKGLPAKVMSLLKLIGDMAQKKDYAAFVVGGFVRDLLMGVKNFDVDIVIEGDAIKNITIGAQDTFSVNPQEKQTVQWGSIRRNALLQNYPNPFNPDTWIPYTLAEDTNVVICIYCSSGRLVRTLDLGYKSAGVYITRERSAYWDGRNDSGEAAASGVYFYTLQVGEFGAAKKMVVMRD